MIIGVSGFARSGKDTVADHLVRHHGFQKHGFAYPVKAMAQIAFGFSSEQLFGSLKETEDKRYRFSGYCFQCRRGCSTRIPSKGWHCNCCGEYYPEFITPRLVLQTLGTEWGRTLYPNIWVDAALREILEKGNDWAIADVRFRNELHGIQDKGGSVIRLKRGEQRFRHASESEMTEIEDSEFDLCIDNTGTLEELYRTVDEAMPGLRAMSQSPT
jgi:hypothetical protein